MSSLPKVDVRRLSEKEKSRLGIYHALDHDFVRGQMARLCGKVRQRQDDLIRRNIVGKRVLDIGAGYGGLALYLKGHGFEVTAIEPHQETRLLARQWFDIDLRSEDIYSIQIPAGSIDTVIFRESVEHVDFELAMEHVRQIAPRRVLIFQSNLTWILKMARFWMKHEEFSPRTAAYYSACLEKFGFPVSRIRYRDVVAFPLSGGFLIRQRFPRLEAAERGLVTMDEMLNRLLETFHLGPWFCWRYLLVGDRQNLGGSE